ncbi:MAG: hypothetical protein Kow0090_09660 [Myxococcota bacterium]
MKRWKRIIVSAAMLLIAHSASAIELEGGIIEGKRHPLAGKHEFMLQFPFQIGSNMTDSKLIGLEYMYHIWEYFGLGLDTAYAYVSNESSTMRRIRQPENAELPGAISVLRNFPIDLDRRVVTYFAGLVAHWYPIYGRWSVAGSYDLSWDIYLQLGGYMVGYKTYAAFWATDEGMKIDESAGGAQNVTAMRPAGNYGLGMRFHFLDYLALRVEYKGYVMFDKGVQYLLPDDRREEFKNGEEWQEAYAKAQNSGDPEAYKSKMLLLNYLVVGIVGMF